MDIEKQYDRLLRYCYMKLRDRPLAEDITQDAFLRLFESTAYINTGKEMAYLYTVARNLCTDYYRKKKDELYDDMPPQVLDEFIGKDTMQQVLERVSIEAALDKLEDAEREAVILRYSGELSIADISEIMQLSRFAVRRRIKSALDKLRKEIVT